MRILAIKAAKTDLQQLLRRPGAAGATLERIKDLNPHLDLNHLKAGDVLLIPDGQDVKSSVGSVVGADSVQALQAEIDAGIVANANDMSTYLQQLDSDRATIGSALRSAFSKRVIIGGTPGLKQQLQAVDAQFAADQRAGADTAQQLAELRQLVASEFAKLQKMLG